MMYEIFQVALGIVMIARGTWQTIPAAALVYAIVTLLHNRYGQGLEKYPGPLGASLTAFWRVWHAYAYGDQRPTVAKFHEKYGSVVRLGPKTLSFSNPSAIPAIYAQGSNMPKSGWYVAFEAHGKGHRKENVFSTRNIHWHARYRGLIQPGFSLKHLGPKEAQIDDLAQMLLRNLDRVAARSDGKGSVDLPLMLQHFTFDAGGVFAFSRPYGFLEKMVDIDGIIQSVRSGSMHLNRLAQAPFLQFVIDKNPMAVYFGLIAPPMAFAKKFLPLTRLNEQASSSDKTFHNHDILDQYIDAYKTNPGVVTLSEVTDLGLMVVVPASEAVRTAISVLVFQMLKHPAALAKLRKEIDETIPRDGSIPSWDLVSTKLPYLDACVKETFRIHPSTGFMMERVVPAGGAIIDGHPVPAGTLVNCSPWVIHRHKPIYGEDVETFRPERWLEAGPEERANMEKTLCPFGFETRLCLGREIALFEVYKISATLFSRYDIELEDPSKDMIITWGNIVSVDFNVRLKKRAV